MLPASEKQKKSGKQPGASDTLPGGEMVLPTSEHLLCAQDAARCGFSRSWVRA